MAPGIAVPLRRHWNVNGPVPSTPTAKVAVLPAFTTTDEGCVTMVGATATGVPGTTFSVATLLSASPAELLTVTVKLPEFSVRDTRQAQHRAVGAGQGRAVADTTDSSALPCRERSPRTRHRCPLPRSGFRAAS